MTRFRLPRSTPLPAMAIALASIVALVGCVPGASIQLPGTNPLVTVTARGGECPGVPCEATIYLDRDGRVHSAAKPPNDLGHVDARAMAALSAAIATTDFAALRAHRFTGECPTAFDGQELIFEFAVGTGTERVASCEVDIDWGHPLFVAVAAAIGAWVPLPVT